MSSTTSDIGGSPSGFCTQAGVNWKPNRKSLLYCLFPFVSSGSEGRKSAKAKVKNDKKKKHTGQRSQVHHLEEVGLTLNCVAVGLIGCRGEDSIATFSLRAELGSVPQQLCFLLSVSFYWCFCRSLMLISHRRQAGILCCCFYGWLQLFLTQTHRHAN